MLPGHEIVAEFMGSQDHQKGKRKRYPLPDQPGILNQVNPLL
jgi:hypothetical protein